MTDLPHRMLSGLIKSENAWEMHLLRPEANCRHGQFTDTLSGSKIFSSSTVLALAHPLFSSYLAWLDSLYRTQTFKVKALSVSPFIGFQRPRVPTQGGVLWNETVNFLGVLPLLNWSTLSSLKLFSPFNWWEWCFGLRCKDFSSTQSSILIRD